MPESISMTFEERLTLAGEKFQQEQERQAEEIKKEMVKYKMVNETGVRCPHCKGKILQEFLKKERISCSCQTIGAVAPRMSGDSIEDLKTSLNRLENEHRQILYCETCQTRFHKLPK